MQRFNYRRGEEVFILTRCYTFNIFRITNNTLEEMTVINGYLRVSSKLGCIREFLDFLELLKEKKIKVFLMLSYHYLVIIKFDNSYQIQL